MSTVPVPRPGGGALAESANALAIEAFREDDARDLIPLWLFTFERNIGARAFYERHGLRIVARGFEPTGKLNDIKYEWSRCREPGDQGASP